MPRKGGELGLFMKQIKENYVSESRDPVSIFVEEGTHCHAWCGKKEEAVMLENNPNSTWH